MDIGNARLLRSTILYLEVSSILLILAGVFAIGELFSWHILIVYTLLLLPPMTANGSAVLAGRFKAVLSKRSDGGVILHPVDGGRLLGGRPVLGPGKTWEGFVLGSISGIIVALILSPISGIQGLGVVEYFSAGVYASVLALVGDMIGSFIKRRAGLVRGEPAPILDQADFYLGGLLGIYLAGYQIDVPVATLYFLIVFGLHVLTDCIAFEKGLKRECP